jgi:hypothetical protein
LHIKKNYPSIYFFISLIYKYFYIKKHPKKTSDAENKISKNLYAGLKSSGHAAERPQLSAGKHGLYNTAEQ